MTMRQNAPVRREAAGTDLKKKPRRAIGWFCLLLKPGAVCYKQILEVHSLLHAEHSPQFNIAVRDTEGESQTNASPLRASLDCRSPFFHNRGSVRRGGHLAIFAETRDYGG